MCSVERPPPSSPFSSAGGGVINRDEGRRGRWDAGDLKNYYILKRERVKFLGN